MTALPHADAPLAAGLSLRRIAAIALLAILLGFAMQAFILAVLLAETTTRDTAAVGLAGGVTWSLLVCSGVAVATSLAKGRAYLSGLIGLCVAPIALAMAKASQKVMVDWLGAAEKQAILSLGTISVLRALEYGLLAWLLGRLVEKENASVWRFLAAGAASGIVFGGAITVLTRFAAIQDGRPLPVHALAATAINEIAFPIGCAFVIFIGQSVGRQITLADASKSA